MTSTRTQLEEALKKYVSETFDYIRTVKDFVDISHSWEEARKDEVEAIKRIKKDEIDDDKDLKVLSDILDFQVRSGLREMKGFLDALEKLSITSVAVFEDKPQAINLRGTDLESVRNIILTAQILSPVLLFFKRNNEDFFQPKLENMEALQLQLKMYTEKVKQICDTWRESSLTNLPLNLPAVEVRGDQSEDVMRKLLFNITEIYYIRLDEDIRMLCLFQGKEQTFMTEFSKRVPDMRMFLQELEACADKLDEMCRASHIAGTVNSSVGITSGVLSILGLIFAPFTAGASLALTATGLGIGVASGISSLVTSATKIGIDQTQANKVEKNFKEFVEDANEIQCCLDNVVQQHFDDLHYGNKVTGAWMSVPAFRLFLKFISIPGLHAKMTAFKATRQLAAQAAVRAAAQAGGQAAAQAGGQAVGDGLSLAGKAGKALAKALPVFNGVFIIYDITNIVIHSINLNKGCETQTSKWIRARVALWRVQVDSWQRMYYPLNRVQQDSEKYKESLKNPLSVTWTHY